MKTATGSIPGIALKNPTHQPILGIPRPCSEKSGIPILNRGGKKSSRSPDFAARVTGVREEKIESGGKKKTAKRDCRDRERLVSGLGGVLGRVFGAV